MKMRPDQSKFSNSEKSGWSKSISASAASVTMMPGTMLMKNSQCQDSASVEIAADGRADGRRQRRDEPDQRQIDHGMRERGKIV